MIKKRKYLSDYIYLDGEKWEDLLIKHDNFDIIFSGTIPPNPTELLGSEKFKNFIDNVKTYMIML